ncbi:MAG: hypothetical protein PHU25_15785 [Deltaproteobacteria bacterium]|nr:hypothetical protein [Deltaproteobacteria bacterium]
MPRDTDSDRPKKSWRDIDKQKDRSLHRKEDKPAFNPKSQQRADSASKVYKAKLDGFFEGGKAPDHVRAQLKELEDASPEGKERVASLAAIKSATAAADVEKAVAAYVARWELPPDYEILGQALLVSDEGLLGGAMDAIGVELAARHAPRRTQVLETRLRRIITLGDDPSLKKKAEELLKALRLYA